MIQVNFYDAVDDSLIKFAVIGAFYHGRQVFCKHRQRDTYEMPGGHREPMETVLEAAKRELFEETGALEFSITPVCVYSVQSGSEEGESYGMLYRAEISVIGPLPESEIEQVLLLENPPGRWTYPEIQPKLMKKLLAMA